LISTSRVKALQTLIEKKRAKPDKQDRLTLQALDRLYVAEQALLDVCVKFGYDEIAADGAKNRAEIKLRREGKIR
jgi:hypothetical protein